MESDEVEYAWFKIHITRSRYDYRSDVLFYTTFATIYAVSRVTGQHEFTVRTDFLVYQFWLKERVKRIVRHGDTVRVFIGNGYIDVGLFYLKYPRAKELYTLTPYPVFVMDKDEDYVLVVP